MHLRFRRQHKKYGGKITNVQRKIDFDIRHGVTIDEVIAFLDKIRDLMSVALISKETQGTQEHKQKYHSYVILCCGI